MEENRSNDAATISRLAGELARPSRHRYTSRSWMARLHYSHLMSDPRTDRQLIAAANRGDADAFEALYQRHKQWAANLAYRYTRDHELALDAMQETFIYLLNKLPNLTLNENTKMTTFLFPVVKHNAQAALRKKSRLNLAQDSGVFKSQRNAANDPTAAAHEEEGVAAIVASLAEHHREVLLLRFVDDLTLPEIAAALEIPLGTVKSRLHHGIAKLRDNPACRKFFEME